MSQRFRLNKRSNKCVTSPIMFLLLGLGLASQEVDVLTKSTNESTQILYGYKEMTKPQFLVQAKIQLGQDVIIKLGLV
jgi:hypothetical protein